MLLTSVVELLPQGEERTSALSEYLTYLVRSDFQRRSRIERFFHARLLLLRIADLPDVERNELLHRAGILGDPVFAAYARLAGMAPELLAKVSRTDGRDTHGCWPDAGGCLPQALD